MVSSLTALTVTVDDNRYSSSCGNLQMLRAAAIAMTLCAYSRQVRESAKGSKDVRWKHVVDDLATWIPTQKEARGSRNKIIPIYEAMPDGRGCPACFRVAPHLCGLLVFVDHSDSDGWWTPGECCDVKNWLEWLLGRATHLDLPRYIARTMTTVKHRQAFSDVVVDLTRVLWVMTSGFTSGNGVVIL